MKIINQSKHSELAVRVIKIKNTLLVILAISLLLTSFGEAQTEERKQRNKEKRSNTIAASSGLSDNKTAQPAVLFTEESSEQLQLPEENTASLKPGLSIRHD
ncbi:MAG: hypothetical protein LBI42_05770 [Chitinispirillales bacterium]|jgi:hypothetical protein|nr:hypothetical protein [Chitinispirillales bacterium]